MNKDRLEEIRARCDTIQNGKPISKEEIFEYALHARRDIPDLLAEVERLRNQLLKAKSALETNWVTGDRSAYAAIVVALEPYE